MEAKQVELWESDVLEESWDDLSRDKFGRPTWSIHVS